MKKRKLQLLAGVVLLGFLTQGSLAAEEEPQPLELDGTEWQVRFICEEETKNIPQEDRLVFKEGRFILEGFQEKYEPTNYTLSVDGQDTIFQTMQTREGERAFWRLQFRDEATRGIFSIHPDEKEPLVCNVRGELSKGELERREAPERPDEPVVEEEKPAEKAEETPEKLPEAYPEEPVEVYPEEPKGEKGLFERLFRR